MNYSYKQIWLINFPVMMSILMEQLINITDAVFLGHVGEVALGASAIAGIYYLAIYMLGFGFSIGLQVMIARRNGERNYKATGKTFFQGLFFLSGLAIPLCLLIQIISPLILKRLITSPEIYQAVVRYLDWRSFGLLFSFPFLAIRSFFVGITFTKALSWAAIIAVIINISLNYFLIFALELDISGAAIASSLAEMGSLVMLCIYMYWKIDKEKYGLYPGWDGKLLVNVLNLSVWSMFHAFISVAPWFLFFVAIEHLGRTELAISNITRSVSALFFVIANSFAVTTGSLVSNAIGAGVGNELFAICSKVLKLGYAIGVPLVGIAMCCNRWIVGFYTDSETLIQLAFVPFIVMLLNYTFALPGYVYLNAVGGTGKTKITFLFQVTTTFVYLTYLFLLSFYTQVSLAVYLTAEYLFVILLAVQSIIYLKYKHY
ncbi:MATE family efflux transporter [Oscillospiraceae bacterium N12]|jgi:putative MATE family efflux protein|uniref:MATE family efflux transporter n=1 Tax=Jilunia laotingensis TaxID=2763675 RepID=A0A926F3Y9_9BACT|nr:MATE family efflux transporter [Jilunia laotingensis]MBC8593585.1 MATE family efflux transporter [Jilunia laotingensis]